jgi:hypothetical protein
MNKELAKTLTTALVQFIDRERPEGTMCCSNTDCERLETSFEVLNLAFIEKFIKSKLLGSQTEFEQEVSDIVEYCKEHGKNVAFDYAKRHANTLLSLARRELLSYADESNPAIEAMADLERAVTCGNVDNIPKWLVEELDKAFKKGQESSHEDYIRGYNKGYKDAEKWYNNRVASRSPIMPTPLSGWDCDGTHCTNPQMDCINCPRKNIGGGFNMQSGTSAAKMEG